jgi:hypothetical protein
MISKFLMLIYLYLCPKLKPATYDSSVAICCIGFYSYRYKFLCLCMIIVCKLLNPKRILPIYFQYRILSHHLVI